MPIRNKNLKAKSVNESIEAGPLTLVFDPNGELVNYDETIESIDMLEDVASLKSISRAFGGKAIKSTSLESLRAHALQTVEGEIARRGGTVRETEIEMDLDDVEPAKPESKPEPAVEATPETDPEPAVEAKSGGATPGRARIYPLGTVGVRVYRGTEYTITNTYDGWKLSPPGELYPTLNVAAKTLTGQKNIDAPKFFNLKESGVAAPRAASTGQRTVKGTAKPSGPPAIVPRDGRLPEPGGKRNFALISGDSVEVAVLRSILADDGSESWRVIRKDKSETSYPTLDSIRDDLAPGGGSPLAALNMGAYEHVDPWVLVASIANLYELDIDEIVEGLDAATLADAQAQADTFARALAKRLTLKAKHEATRKHEAAMAELKQLAKKSEAQVALLDVTFDVTSD